MHLRRALLLFAIVLGLAAIAASFARPPETAPERRDGVERAGARQPRATPGPAALDRLSGGGTRELRLDGRGKPERIRLEPREPARVVVAVEQPGQVELGGLGLLSQAEPLTPAIFDVFVTEPGVHGIRFTPQPGDGSRRIGTLVVGRSGR